MGNQWVLYHPSGNMRITGGTFTLTNSSGASNPNGTGILIDGGAFEMVGGTVNSIAYGVAVRNTSGAILRSTTVQSSSANYPTVCTYDRELDVYSCTIKNTASNATAVQLISPTTNRTAIRLYDCATTGKMNNGVVLVNKTSTGYQVRLFPRTTAQPSSVRMASWTTASGQNDLKWNSMSKYSTSGSATGSAFTYTVLKSDHGNATGEYNSHIYVTVNGSEYLFTGFTYTI